jgi:hypothetical protein
MIEICRADGRPRLLFGLAGTMTIAGVVLTAAVSPWFLLLVGFVGINELVYATAGECPASLLLRKACEPKGLAR